MYTHHHVRMMVPVIIAGVSQRSRDTPAIMKVKQVKRPLKSLWKGGKTPENRPNCVRRRITTTD